MDAMVASLEERGIALPHDCVVSRVLARVLCGGDAARGEELDEDAILDLEREAFLALAAMPATVDRIEHMLRTGRALRN